MTKKKGYKRYSPELIHHRSAIMPMSAFTDGLRERMIRQTSSTLTCLVLAAAGSTVSGQEVEAFRGYIDVHVHLRSNALLPGSPGPREYTEEAYLSSATNLIALMNDHGVEKAFIMPPPQIPEQGGPGNYELLLPIVDRFPGRLYLLAGGKELNTLIHGYGEDEVTEEIKEQFRTKAEALLGLGASGFGEMTALHLSFNQRHPFEEVQLDHPLFLLLADIAGENGAPIDIHTEAVAEEMELPDGLSRRSANNPSTLQANIPGFERLLAHNRAARIVWQHVGWDNTGHMTVDLLRRLLESHSNLYMALKVEERLNDFAGRPMRNRIVDEDWKINENWMDLFEDFADKFVIGTDEFIRLPGATVGSPLAFKETWPLLEQLPLGIREKIGRENAARIYNLH